MISQYPVKRGHHHPQASDYFQCSVDVRQGENLSPCSFAINLNDLEDFIVSKEFEGFETSAGVVFVILLEILELDSNCLYGTLS
jgi:hypothetical protein